MKYIIKFSVCRPYYNSINNWGECDMRKKFHWSATGKISDV